MGIPLSLTDVALHVERGLLGFNNADGCQSREQNVVRWPGGGRPFGDREVASFLRPRAVGVSQRTAVGFPAIIAKLGVDQSPGCGFIKIDLAGSRGCRLFYLGACVLVIRLGSGSQCIKFLLKGNVVGFDLLGQFEGRVTIGRSRGERLLRLITNHLLQRSQFGL